MKGGSPFMEGKVKKAKINEIRQFLQDIEGTTEEMANTDQGEVRAMQQESIKFRIEKIKENLKELG